MTGLGFTAGGGVDLHITPSVAFEFALLFTDFVAFAGRGNTPLDAPPKAKLVANLRITPDVFFQLAAAAASNWNKYVERFGDPNQPAPKFKLLGTEAQLEGLRPDEAQS